MFSATSGMPTFWNAYCCLVGRQPITADQVTAGKVAHRERMAKSLVREHKLALVVCAPKIGRVGLERSIARKRALLCPAGTLSVQRRQPWTMVHHDGGIIGGP